MPRKPTVSSIRAYKPTKDKLRKYMKQSKATSEDDAINKLLEHWEKYGGSK